MEREPDMFMPPNWCSPICRNSMSQVCVENCAIVRDTSGFELKPGMNMENIPRYPLNETERMTKEEKFKSVVVYLSKVVDHLKGVDDGEDLYYPTGRRVSADFKKQDVRLGKEREDSPPINREKQENKRERPVGVD